MTHDQTAHCTPAVQGGQGRTASDIERDGRVMTTALFGVIVLIVALVALSL